MRSLETPDTLRTRSTSLVRGLGHQASEDLFVFSAGHGVPMELDEKVAKLRVLSSPPLHKNEQFLLCSVTNRVLVQLDMLRSWKEATACRRARWIVANLHLPALSAELTVLTQGQADYAGVKVESSFEGGYGRCCVVSFCRRCCRWQCGCPVCFLRPARTRSTYCRRRTCTSLHSVQSSLSLLRNVIFYRGQGSRPLSRVDTHGI